MVINCVVDGKMQWRREGGGGCRRGRREWGSGEIWLGGGGWYKAFLHSFNAVLLFLNPQTSSDVAEGRYTKVW